MTGTRRGDGSVDRDTTLLDTTVLDATQSPSAAAAIERALLGDMSRTEVILVRHGQQAFRGTGGRRGDVIDSPLTEVGEHQAHLAGAYLADDGITTVYSSGLRRAVETAAIIAARLPGDVTPTRVDELREVELFRDVPRDRNLADVVGHGRLLSAAEEFRRTRRFDAFPGSEASAALRARAVTAIQRLVSQHESDRIAVVAHGGVINAFLAEVLGIREDMFFFPAHASVSRALHSDGRWALYSANETAHLRAGDLVTF